MAKTALSTIGIIVKINNVAVWGATDFGDLGAEPNLIDATKLTDAVRVNIMGVQDQGTFNITYQYEGGEATNDYKRIKALKGTKNVPVSISIPNGETVDVFSNTGEVSTYVNGAGVGDVITATASFALDGEWVETSEAVGGGE